MIQFGHNRSNKKYALKGSEPTLQQMQAFNLEYLEDVFVKPVLKGKKTPADLFEWSMKQTNDAGQRVNTPSLFLQRLAKMANQPELPKSLKERYLGVKSWYSEAAYTLLAQPDLHKTVTKEKKTP
jgi:hypothetical protein